MIRTLLLMLAVVTAAPAAAQPVQLVSAGHARMDVEVGKGRLLKLTRNAATVFVADPEIADIQVKSPRLVYVFAKKPGETTVFAVDGGDDVLASVEITVSHNLAKLGGVLESIAPGAGLVLTSVGDQIMIEGVVETASAAEDVRRAAAAAAGDPEKVMLRLGVSAPSQVNLRVRVAEVSRDIDKQFGFNWSAIGTVAGFSLGLATANPFAANVTQHTLTIGADTGGFDLNTVIDALEGEGLVSVLAEPNLTAMSGETASFLAGGEFPILVPDSDGRVTIEFKKFGVSLAFTPTLMGADRLNLHVRPEVSQLSTQNAVTLNNFSIPSLTTRRADTTVELSSGQSFAIAGLIQNNVTHDISEFPGLGEIPVLGGLFRSDRFQREESELVIIVTPYIVRPMNRRVARLPNDGLQHPTDGDRFIVGGTAREVPETGGAKTVDGEGRALIGAVGFVLDDDAPAAAAPSTDGDL
jgi:pilus assembly protein CpaC